MLTQKATTQKSDAPCVIVLGACGRFGAAAALAFSQAGWNVVGQHRPGRTPPAIPGVRWLGAEPGDVSTFLGAVRSAQVVVHALNPPYTDAAWNREIPALAQAAIRVTRAFDATLMMPANVYNFGATMPEALHEGTFQQASTQKGRLRVAVEDMIERATRDRSMRAVMLRGGNFFGSGTGSWFDRVMVKSLKNGHFTYPGSMHIKTPWAYLPDMARTMVRIAHVRESLRPFATFHFAGHQLSGQDWVNALREVMNPDTPITVKQVPWRLFRILGTVLPTVGALCSMRYLWETPHYLVNDKLEQLIGPEPNTPLTQALRQSLRELKLLTRREILGYTHTDATAS